jgi:hypothetical protein
MPFEDRTSPGREWRVDKHGDARKGAALHESDEVDEQLLRPLDGKGWDQQSASPLRGRVDLCAQRVTPSLRRRVLPVRVAVGRLADHVIETLRGFGIELKEFVVGPDVTEKRIRIGGPCSLVNSTSMEADPSRWPAFQ